MSEKKDDGVEPESTKGEGTGSLDDTVVSSRTVVVDEEGPEGEAHSRRRALVILVVVVVLALVAALVIWSVTSGSSPTTGAAPTTSASASSSASAEPSAEEPGAEETPGIDAPSGGTVSDDIREFDDEAEIGGDVSVALSKIEAIDGEAEGPGEISGPSIRFTVTFTNSGDSAYSLAGAVTNLYYGAEQVPAIPLRGPGGVPFPAEVAPGETATGTFVYNVPVDERGQVRITVDYEAAEPALVFEGAGPT